MKRVLLVFFLFSFSAKIFAQQFSQYNTGTLYDSFENPAQKAFIPDSSKKYATNLLFPNFNANFFITGDAQATLKSRAFLNKYDNSLLLLNQGRFNHFNGNANVYLIMFKMFSSFNGDTELGFSVQNKMESRSIFSDETALLLNGPQGFTGNAYAGIFNNTFSYQSYNQFGFTYKEKINNHFTLGAKLSFLLGVISEKVNIINSQIVFDKPNDSAILGLAGVYQSSYIPGHFIARDFLPTFRNPGAAISLGASYRTEDGFIIQGNIKDLGFIHWSKRSIVSNFADIRTISGLSTKSREDSIYNGVNKILRSNEVTTSFTTPINGRAELSVNKQFWIDDNKNFKYSPTLIASKELFYPGFIGALVNPVQYKSYVLTLTTTYDDMKLFNVGGQFMYKTPNFEFYIGSDRLMQSARLAKAAVSHSPTDQYSNLSYTGADFFLGLAFRLGPVIEHPMNSSTIPMGEKGFLGRFWGRLFKTDQ
ncbi:MAG: DUF5723 family protein [Mucilaginibacter sp.]